MVGLALLHAIGPALPPRRWEGWQRRHSSGAIGTRSRCSCAGRCPASRACSRDGAASRSPARRRRVAARRARRRPLVACPRPVPPRRLQALPAHDWTLLVQGVNLVAPAGDALLRRFSFLPYARLDDLMVSYAAPGGGVGPHFDSYDVFLLQGFGRRRWRYGRQDRPRAEAGAAAEDPAPVPPERTTTCSRPATCSTCRRSTRTTASPIDACTTYSIGFRAPRRDRACRRLPRFPARRARPARPLRRPGSRAGPRARRIGPAMQAALRATCSRGIALGPGDGRALSRLLAVGTETAGVLRWRPARCCRRRPSRTRAAKHGVHLDPRTQLLYDARPPVHQRRCAGVAGRRAARRSAARQRSRSLAGSSRTAYTALQTAGILYELVLRWLPPRRHRLTSGESADPLPQRELLATVAEQVAAIDTLLGLARHSIRVFDVDLPAWAGTARHAPRRSRRSCAIHPAAKVDIIVHDTRWIERSCPRLAVAAEFRSHAITIRRTGQDAREVDGSAADRRRRHYLHRFHVDAARARRWASTTPSRPQPLVTRFDEISEGASRALRRRCSGSERRRRSEGTVFWCGARSQ